MNYIVSDNENIIGCFEEKINAIIYLLDCIINKYNFYLEILKLNNEKIVSPEMNIYKLTSIIHNIHTIDIFYVNRLELIKDLISSNSDNVILNYKINILKKIIFQIDEIKKGSELNNSEELNNSPIINNLDIEDIKKTIQKLTLQKQTQEDKVVNANNTFNEININKLNKEREINREKEKVDEYKRRYNADISVYLTIKNSIEEKKTDIPELFENQYPILKVLDKLNLLNTQNGFNFYYKKIKQINEIKCQNTKYSNIFNDGSVFYTNKKEEFSDSSDDETDLEANMIDDNSIDINMIDDDSIEIEENINSDDEFILKTK